LPLACRKLAQYKSEIAHRPSLRRTGSRYCLVFLGFDIAFPNRVEELSSETGANDGAVYRPLFFLPQPLGEPNEIEKTRSVE
jgi:hypothetical protein